MKRVQQLEGAELDYWVARALGYEVVTGLAYRDPDDGMIRVVPSNTPSSKDFEHDLYRAKIEYDAVKSEDGPFYGGYHWVELEPIQEWSTNWCVGGPLIQKYIKLLEKDQPIPDTFMAFTDDPGSCPPSGIGCDPLAASCRAIVTSAYGEYVE